MNVNGSYPAWYYESALGTQKVSSAILAKIINLQPQLSIGRQRTSHQT